MESNTSIDIGPETLRRKIYLFTFMLQMLDFTVFYKTEKMWAWKFNFQKHSNMSDS